MNQTFFTTAAEVVHLSKRLLLGEVVLALILGLLYGLGGFLPDEFAWLMKSYLPVRAVCCAAALRLLTVRPASKFRPETTSWANIILNGHLALTASLVAAMALGRVLDFSSFVNALAIESILFGLIWGLILPDLSFAALENTGMDLDIFSANKTAPSIENLRPKQAAQFLITEGYVSEALEYMIGYWEHRDNDCHQILLARKSEFSNLRNERQKGALSPVETRYQLGQIRGVLIEIAQKMEAG